ncbi:HNH endonuclease [Mycobacterium phage Glexan]|nr:HNH endonuclease [Mycobacterium phage Glexan]
MCLTSRAAETQKKAPPSLNHRGNAVGVSGGAHDTIIGEVIKPYPPNPKYKVSDDGRVFGFKGQELKRMWTPSGYRRVNIYYPDGTVRKQRVHRMVLETFVGPCPPGMEACHNNGTPGDNRLSNLRWDTPKANQADKVKHGRPTSPGAAAARLRERDECRNGHLYTPENTYTHPSRPDRRKCRQCAADARVRYKARAA